MEGDSNKDTEVTEGIPSSGKLKSKPIRKKKIMIFKKEEK